MRDIVARIDSLDDLIQDLMMYASRDRHGFSPVNLRHVIDEAVTMLRRDPAGSGLQIHIEGEAGDVTVDPDLIAPQ
jgi:signal transduction histidine kinase